MYRTYIERHARGLLFLMAVLTATVMTAAAAFHIETRARLDMQRHISEEVLRFHVLANSDSEKDQSLKLTVRDAVLAYLEEELPAGLDVEETTQWVREHIDGIETVSRQALTEAGSDQTVSAAVTTCFFPDKTYGDVTFPAGNYEALRVELGAARGHNWWCVLYPNLCFLDAANAVVPDEGKEQLKNVLTEEEYSSITATSDFEISWFFWKGK